MPPSRQRTTVGCRVARLAPAGGHREARRARAGAIATARGHRGRRPRVNPRTQPGGCAGARHVGEIAFGSRSTMTAGASRVTPSSGRAAHEVRLEAPGPSGPLARYPSPLLSVPEPRVLRRKECRWADSARWHRCVPAVRMASEPQPPSPPYVVWFLARSARSTRR